MEINGRLLSADAADSEAVARLDEALRAWEPTLGLDVLRGEARLFDGESTLYAVCLSESATLDPERRRLPVARGDLVVLPQSVALDLDPPSDWVVVRVGGRAPHHFRERFIQVWGFEQFRAPAATGGRVALIAPDDVRHALSYSVAGPDGPELAIEGATGYDAALAVGIDGEPTLARRSAESDAEGPLPAGAVALLGPGVAYRIGGAGRVGWLTLRTELARAARLRSAPGAVSPEFGGPSAPPTGPGPVG